MSRTDSLLERLPYYWEGPNIESFMSIIGSVLDDVESNIDDVRISRRLTQLEDGEEIAHGANLDKLAMNVGQVRNKEKFIDDSLDIDVQDENDEMFRRRVLWNIDLQQSGAVVEQLKRLVTEGLVMYRVRTGLGGMVNENKVTANDFLADLPPEWDVSADESTGDRRYIEPSDIHIFANQEPRLGMSAPDSWHGKYGNFTNQYIVNIPWEAMPWSEGEKSLIWRSQDDFYRPINQSFSGDDLSSGILSIENTLDNSYPVVSVIDSEGYSVQPDGISVNNSTVEVDLTTKNVEDGWHIRLTGGGYRKGFFDSDLSSGTLSITHNLGTPFPDIAIYNDSDEYIAPDNINFVSNDQVDVDLSSYTVSGTWNVSVIGGDDIVTRERDFTNDDLVVDTMIVHHALDAEALNIVVVDNNGERIFPQYVQELANNRLEVKFSSPDPVVDTWHLQVSSAKGEIPEDDVHGWDESVYTGPKEDIHIEPLQKLADLTRPAATQVGIYGYGGVIWTSQEEFDDPSDPPKDKEHGWNSRWDGDVEDLLYAMENLDGFWINYD